MNTSGGSFKNLKALLDYNEEKANTDFVHTGSSSDSPSSLLDILIKAEEGIQQIGQADPVDRMEDIGETVISQLTGEIGLGEDEESIRQNAFKLFDEAMSYSKPVLPQKRKYTRWKHPVENKAVFPAAVPPVVEKADTKSTIPRAKFAFQILHEKLEEERETLFEDQVSKDVDRLLQAANRIYGPKIWSDEEKAEFAKYYILREGVQFGEWRSATTGRPTDCRAAANGNDDAKSGSVPTPTSSPIKRKTNHKEEEELLYPKRATIEMKGVKIEIKEEDVDPYEEGCSTEVAPPPVKMQFTPFHPGMKYEKEKEFRAAAINIFMEVFLNVRKFTSSTGSSDDPIQARRRGRPRVLYRPAVPTPDEQAKRKEEDLKYLSRKMNEVMNEEEKVWSVEELDELGRFYHVFREKMNLTIIQTKELGNFLRKAFGRLEQYEIERENDAALKEKRKYWQEYKRTHEPSSQRGGKRTAHVRTTPVRPYIKTNIDTTGETEEQRKARKAAYLRAWRVRRAEQQNTQLASFLGITSPDDEGNSE
ncbi:unnamed protein product [Caenorhabditis sp. 36 PRJEB53466]|nr:unnamed protein product [Caenorhabditis sp. 36 PRJEB53466]